MNRVFSFLGGLPLVPSRWSKGSEWAAAYLQDVRGDNDAVGFIRSNNGWELIPGDLEIDDDEQYFVPADGSREFPADGIPSNPQQILGCPAVIGYKDFGSLNEIPGVEIAENETVIEFEPVEPEPTRDEMRAERTRYFLANDSIPKPADGDDGDDETYSFTGVCEAEEHRDADWVTADSLLDDEFVPDSGWLRGKPTECWVVEKEIDGIEFREVIFEEPAADDTVVEKLVKPEIFDDSPGVRERVSAWLWERKQARAWSWMEGDSDTVLLAQDDDSGYALDRSDYEFGEGPDWFVAVNSDYYYDARGKGGSPDGFVGGASLGLCYSDVPKLLAPVLCRIGRNIHERRAEPYESATIGGKVKEISVPSTDELFEIEGPGGTEPASSQVLADGGVVEENAVNTNRGDVFIEERALIMPEDIKLLGGNRLTQDMIQTEIDQMTAKENPPGSKLKENLPEYGILMVTFILGAMLVGDANVAGAVGESIPMFLGVI